MKEFDYIILGTGAAGLQLAFRMCRDPFFQNKKVLLIDKEIKKGNDRTWCFWEKGAGEWDDIIHKNWDQISFKSRFLEKKIKLAPYRYKMIRSEEYYKKLWEVISLTSNVSFLQASVTAIRDLENAVEVVANQTSFYASKVFSSIHLNQSEALQNSLHPFLQQHFVGWFVKTEKPVFDKETATFMDFNIPQNGNTRFMYVLPTNEYEALVEYTLFSEKLLEKKVYEKAIEDYLLSKGLKDYEIIEKESGNIPMTSFKFHKKNSKNILYIGTAGGWTKASTGYTFKNVEKKTKHLLEFLKKEEDFLKFQKINIFWYTDLLMLKVLSDDNSYGEQLFSDLFKNNDPQQLFKFLDEETSPLELIKLMTSVNGLRYVKAIFKIFYLKFTLHKKI